MFFLYCLYILTRWLRETICQQKLDSILCYSPGWGDPLLFPHGLPSLEHSSVPSLIELTLQHKSLTNIWAVWVLLFHVCKCCRIAIYSEYFEWESDLKICFNLLETISYEILYLLMLVHFSVSNTSVCLFLCMHVYTIYIHAEWNERRCWLSRWQRSVFQRCVYTIFTLSVLLSCLLQSPSMWTNIRKLWESWPGKPDPSGVTLVWSWVLLQGNWRYMIVASVQKTR